VVIYICSLSRDDNFSIISVDTGYVLFRPAPDTVNRHIHIFVVTGPFSIFNFSHSPQKKRHDNK
jgi:hypothetical protein